MKTLLIGINAKYIHPNLAIRLLKKNTKYPVDIKEFNKFYWLYLKFEFSTCEYVKPSKSCTGSWSKEKNLKENRGCESLLQSATVEENDTSFIGEFEDLESWERRNYGRFDD